MSATDSGITIPRAQRMDMQPIEPHRPMTVQLTAEQWNVVMFALRKHAMPFEVSAPIIEGLTAQLQQQAQQRMTAEDVERFIPDGP
jgi:sulfur relay (sulfurtransferase) DsrC/TusE family protein